MKDSTKITILSIATITLGIITISTILKQKRIKEDLRNSLVLQNYHLRFLPYIQFKDDISDEEINELRQNMDELQQFIDKLKINKNK